MAKYPKTERQGLLARRAAVTEDERKIAKRFDQFYFDTDRRYGYGGYYYDPKWFRWVVEDFISHYKLTADSKILDVGCGKGFMLADFRKALPMVEVAGVDISDYVLSCALTEVSPFLHKASCDSLPFDNNSFDLVVSIGTIHNLKLDGVRKSLKEINRVSRGAAFIKVNGYRNLAERENLERWNLVAETILGDSEWEELFAEVGYKGDWDFFRT